MMLSRRQLEILPLLATIQRQKEIAHRLNISRKTVESHKFNIMQKLNISTQADLVFAAIGLGLLPDYYAKPKKLPPLEVVGVPV